MSELIYCPMLRYDIEECAMLAAQSYADYEYFTAHFPDRERRVAFLNRAILSEYRTTFGRAHFLVARQDGLLVAEEPSWRWHRSSRPTTASRPRCAT